MIYLTNILHCIKLINGVKDLKYTVLQFSGLGK